MDWLSPLMVQTSYLLILGRQISHGSSSKKPTKSSAMELYPDEKTSSLPNSNQTDDGYSLIISLSLGILSPTSDE
nr:hypothetical protein CFP56_47026 [Quercus suber]